MVCKPTHSMHPLETARLRLLNSAAFCSGSRSLPQNDNLIQSCHACLLVAVCADVYGYLFMTVNLCLVWYSDICMFVLSSHTIQSLSDCLVRRSGGLLPIHMRLCHWCVLLILRVPLCSLPKWSQLCQLPCYHVVDVGWLLSLTSYFIDCHHVSTPEAGNLANGGAFQHSYARDKMKSKMK